MRVNVFVMSPSLKPCKNLAPRGMKSGINSEQGSFKINKLSQFEKVWPKCRLLFCRHRVVSRACKKLYNKKARFVKDVEGKFSVILDE